MKPKTYQQRALDQLQVNNWNGLIGAGLGTGKTAMACWSIKAADARRVLIVAPLHTEPGWRKHVEKLLDTELLTVSNKRKKERENLENLNNGAEGIYFIGWELLQALSTFRVWSDKEQKWKTAVTSKPLNGKRLDMVVADEWHRASNIHSNNYKVMKRLRTSHKLALSATPAGSHPCNIFAAYQWLWPEKFRSIIDFREEHFESEENRHNYYGKNYLGEKNPGWLQQNVPCHIRITQEEANPELPPVIIKRETVKLSREQRKIYDDWDKKCMAWLNANPVAISLPPEGWIRLGQATLGEPTLKYNEDGASVVTYNLDCKSTKIDRLLDIMKDLPEGEKVIVWVHSQRFIPAVVHRLNKAGYKAVEISGKSKHSYEEMINGTAQILVAQHSALAEGTDGLQHVCNVEVWLSLAASPIINEQATGRLNRQGQKNPVVRYLIQAENTKDQQIEDRLAERYGRLQQSGLI